MFLILLYFYHSELLRKSAEHSLSEMVRLLYARLPQFPLQETKGSVNYKVKKEFLFFFNPYFSTKCLFQKLKMRTAAYDPSRNKKKPRSSPKPRPKTLAVTNSHSKGSGATPTTEAPSAIVETPTVKETPIESPTASSVLSVPEEPPGSQPEAPDTEAAEQTPMSAHPAVVLQFTEPEPTSMELDGNRSSMATGATTDDSCETAAKDYINAQGVRFITTGEQAEEPTTGGRTHVPYGLPCVRELLRFLVSLINPLERQNNEAMIHIGLKLLTVAFETAADAIASVPSLLALIQDETCRFLFALLSSERLSMLAAACRLCFLLFESARHRLKFQLETYLLKLMEIVAHESPKVAYERRLIALEAVSQLCRIPGTKIIRTFSVPFLLFNFFFG